MFDFSVIPMVFRMGTHNCTSRFRNLSYRIPILKWDTSMNLWLNFLIIFIKVYLLNEGKKFNPFSCSILSVISMVFRMGTQNCTSRFHNLGYCIPILKWDTSMNLWVNSLLFYIKCFLFKAGQNVGLTYYA